MNQASKARILVVDDEPAVRQLVARWLTTAGYVVTEADGAAATARKLDDGTAPDLLLVDIAMPAGSPHGLSIARMAQARDPNLKVIFMTGADVAEYAMSSRTDVVLQKPFTDEVLIDAVARVLGEPPVRA